MRQIRPIERIADECHHPTIEWIGEGVALDESEIAAQQQAEELFWAREGEKVWEEVLNTIEDDEDIAILVLAAAPGKEGPGPLCASIGKNAGDFPIPVAIVPGHLSDAELDSMS